MENLDVRILISSSGLKHKDVSKRMKISPTWFSKLLRFPLSDENRARILSAIEELTRERDGDGETG